jgi:hypothetical protein
VDELLLGLELSHRFDNLHLSGTSAAMGMAQTSLDWHQDTRP